MKRQVNNNQMEDHRRVRIIFTNIINELLKETHQITAIMFVIN